jgi:hypothetical protein
MASIPAMVSPPRSNSNFPSSPPFLSHNACLTTVSPTNYSAPARCGGSCWSRCGFRLCRFSPTHRRWPVDRVMVALRFAPPRAHKPLRQTVRMPQTPLAGRSPVPCKSIARFACIPQTATHLRHTRNPTSSWFRADSRCQWSGRLFSTRKNTFFGHGHAVRPLLPLHKSTGFAPDS